MLWAEDRQLAICERCGARVSSLRYRRFHGEYCTLVDHPEVAAAREKYKKCYSDYVAALVEINNYHSTFLNYPTEVEGRRLNPVLSRLKNVINALKVAAKELYTVFEQRRAEVESQEPPKKYKNNFKKKKNVGVSESNSRKSS